MKTVSFTIFLFVLISLLFFAQSNCYAQKDPTGDPLNEIGSWPFGSHTEGAIDEARNLAFVNSGGAVLILDISTITSPVLVNDLIRTKGVVNDIIYNPTTQNLYVSLGANGLEIWDVQNINSPQHLSSLLLNYYNTIPPATEMSSKSGFIFIAAEYAGIITVNVSDPSNPYQSSFNLGTGQTKYALDLSDDGSFLVASSGHNTELFVVNSDGSISLIDEGPPLVGAEEIHIIGTYSFQVLDGTLYVLDLNSIGLPVVASYNLLGNSTTYYSLTSFNNRLYVSDPFYGIEIFDVSNPLNPVLLGSYATNCNDVKYFNDHVFVSDGSGLTILDVSNPSSPSFTSSYEGVGGITRDIKISGAYCYLCTFSNLYVIDISNPVLPALIGNSQPALGFDLHIQISGNYAFITNYIEGIRVVDISDPSNPVEIGNAGSAYFNYIAMDGNYLYVTDNQNNLKVFDISNPVAPNEVGSLNFPAPNDLTSRISALNGYVYVAQYNAGLKVIDVTDPTQPTQVATYTQNVELTHLDAQGDYVYACNSFQTSNLVDIFDVTDPLNPVIVGTKVFSDPPPRAYENFVFGDVLLVADHFDPYLTVLDVSNPSQPSQISTQMVADQVWGIDATENYFYVATYNAGLHIYENPYGILPVEVTSFTASVSEDNVTLSWRTATEKNNSGFKILRSIQNENNWNQLGFIEGHGTSTEPINYFFTDKDLNAGSYSYKLIQVDFDETQTESEIVNVEVSSQPEEYSLSQNYPNPFNPSTKIKYSIPHSSNVTIKVFDILGNEIETLIGEEKPAGTYEINFDASNLPSGVYFYRLKAGSFVETKKMVLMK